MKLQRTTDEEKLEIRMRAKRTVEDMESRIQETEIIQIVDGFKNKFNICETAYKSILVEHQKKKGKQSSSYMKIDMRQVPQALAFAGYTFEKELLTVLFGGSAKEKGKTVKQLRDAATHGLDHAVVNEIVIRKDELFEYMNCFLETIKQIDVTAA